MAVSENVYTWTKVYATTTNMTDPVEAGDEVAVEDRNGGSKQRVLTVTVMTTKTGKNYKVLLLQAL
jgi:hypothetical protein